MADPAPVVETLALPPLQKRYLLDRWAEMVEWMEGKAKQAQRRYYTLRLITVVGAVMVPALVSVTAIDNDRLSGAAKITTWIVSLLVAVSAAVDQLYRFGDRWRHYRAVAEQLNSHGWLYFELAGPYEGPVSHADAFPLFVHNVEELLKADVQRYVTQVAAERKDSEPPAPPAG